MRLGYKGLDTNPYEWPEPSILDSGLDAKVLEKDVTERGKERRAFLKTLNASSPPPVDHDFNEGEKTVWDGKRIMLDNSLGLDSGRKAAVAAGTHRAGGNIVDTIEEADILITRYRWGNIYLKVLPINLSSFCIYSNLNSEGLTQEQNDRNFEVAVSRRRLGDHLCSYRSTTPLPPS